jgi:hypothetical protein
MFSSRTWFAAPAIRLLLCQMMKILLFMIAGAWRGWLLQLFEEACL